MANATKSERPLTVGVLTGVLITAVLLFQCGSLIDGERREAFMEDINEEYEEVREEHYDSLKVGIVLDSSVLIIIPHST